MSKDRIKKPDLNAIERQSHRFTPDELQTSMEGWTDSIDDIRALAEFSSDLVIIVNSQQRITYASDEIANISGYSLKALTGQAIMKFIHPEDYPTFVHIFNACAKDTSLMKTMDIRFKNREGYWNILEAIIKGLASETGEINIVINACDITERKIIQEQIFDLNRLYQILSKIDKSILRIRDPRKLMQETCSIFVEEGLFKTACICIHQPENDSVEPVAHKGMGEKEFSKLKYTLQNVTAESCPQVAAIREGRALIFNNVTHKAKNIPDCLKSFNILQGSFASFPLYQGGRAKGSLNLFIESPNFFSDEIKRLLETLTEDLSYVFDSAEQERQRKLIEEALRQSEIQQKAILSNIPDLAWLKDKKSRFIAANEPFCRASGFTAEQLLHKTDFDIWPKELAQKYWSDDMEVIRSGKRKAVEEPLADKQGKIQWIETIKTPIFNDRGEIVGTTGIARDITERRLAAEMLRESEKRYRTLFEASPVGIGITDLNGSILAANQYMQDLIGYHGKDLNLINFKDIYADSEDHKKLLKLLQKSIKVRDYETLIKNPCGEEFVCLLNVDSIELEGKMVLLVNARDITDRKRMEEEVKYHRDNLAQLVQQRTKELNQSNTELRLEISHRKKAEQAILLYKRLLEFTRDGVYSYRFKDGKLLQSNQGLVDILDVEYNPKELAGKFLKDLMIYTEKEGFIRETLDKCGEIHGFEYHFKTLKGEDKWVLHDSFITVDPETRVPIVEAVVKDITELKRNEQEIASEKEHLKVTLASIADAVIAVDNCGKILLLNQAAEFLTGWSQDEALNLPLEEIFIIISQHNRTMLPSPVKKALKAGKTVQLSNDTLLIAKDGSEKVISYNAAPIKDQTGNIIGVVLVFRDITERKLAEERLKASEERYRELFENASDVIFSINPQGYFIELNKAGEKLSGYSRTEAQMINISQIVTEELKDFVKQKIMDKLEHKETKTSYELDIISKAGELLNFEVYTSIRFKDGEPLEIQGIAHDITQHKKAQREIQSLALELERHNKALKAMYRDLESFSYALAYEMQEPLRVLDGFTQLVAEASGRKADAETKRYIKIIRNNVAKMTQIADQLQTLTRLERYQLIPAKVNIKAMAKEEFKKIMALHPGREICLEISRAPFALGDTFLLQQVIYHLVANAIKFTRNSKNARIEVGGWSEARENVYYVKDNGVGFDMQFKDKLFTILEKLHSSEEFEGAGIGLAMVSRMVLKHGGRVWAKGKPGKGAEFYFALPR